MPPDESVEHVIVEQPEAPAEPEAGAAVVAAQAAVALAGATAAAAELDAAERLRRIEQESEEWRAGLSQELAGVSDSVKLLREVELSEMNAQRLALAESLSMMSERQARLEEAFQSLTPPQSEAVEEAEEANPTLGTAAEIVAGPVEVSSGVSLDTQSENNPPSQSAHPVRRRRWI